jgi:hypothetical protein
MSRRSSNAVKLARVAAARVGTTLDRNGFPVLDDPRHANRLPKRCPEGKHVFGANRCCVFCNERIGADVDVLDDVTEEC